MVVSLYNTKKKELIGVFRNMAIAKRYLFSENSTWNNSRIWNAFLKKSRLHKNIIFEFPVAVRMANEKNLELIGDNEIYISENYPRMSDQKIRGIKYSKSINKIK